uniref:Secreted protein n=1 Tax=Trichogramma kaykai TaxID=54128 RepID=A0ABD2XNZ1_9HYME
MILPVSELLLHRMSSCSTSRHAWHQQQRTPYCCCCCCCAVCEMCTGLSSLPLQRKGNGSARRSSRSRSAKGRSSNITFALFLAVHTAF